MSDELQNLRSQIDKIDQGLMRVLGKRFEVARKIGRYKKEHNLPPRDELREKEMLQQRKGWAQEQGIDPGLAAELFQPIFKKVVQDNENQ